MISNTRSEHANNNTSDVVVSHCNPNGFLVFNSNMALTKSALLIRSTKSM